MVGVGCGASSPSQEAAQGQGCQHGGNLLVFCHSRGDNNLPLCAFPTGGGKRVGCRARNLLRRASGAAAVCMQIGIPALGALERRKVHAGNLSNERPPAMAASPAWPSPWRPWLHRLSFTHHHPSNSTCISSSRRNGIEADRRSGQPLEYKVSRSHATAKYTPNGARVQSELPCLAARSRPAYPASLS